MIHTGCWDKDALDFEDCEHAWCARHRRAKARDWHRQKNQTDERNKAKEKATWSMGYPRWDLPYDIRGEYGTLEKLANEYLGPDFRRRLEQQYLERHELFYYTTRESGLESGAVRMANDYHIRQRAWERHCSGPSDFTRVPRSGNSQRAFPGPIGTN
ncbi:hypothetical protein QBC38DRAFT_449646 [Podospora fimiseda]|uniref:Uncharacterized protein n=1 Tax=Podospora fimiseda TaxID=252190 RepID=A0AAN6YKB5_9PEZI|nr:hypothetical protein QBC38DRAFT_449646 [Podospora fimiseda]